MLDILYYRFEMFQIKSILPSFVAEGLQETIQIFSNLPATLGSKLDPSNLDLRKRRYAIKYKVTVIAGHKFAIDLLNTPTYCSQCKNLIWGLFGIRCKQCKLVCHKKCFEQVGQVCALSQRDVNNEQQGQQPSSSKQNASNEHYHHTFKPECFLPTDPTFCDHCGTLIASLTTLHQGLKCSSCQLSVHHECRTLVCADCSNVTTPSDNKLDENNAHHHHHRRLVVDNHHNNATATNNNKQIQLFQKKTPQSSEGRHHENSDCTETAGSGNNNNNNNSGSLQDERSRLGAQNNSQLSISDFEIVRLLGTGSFSKVYLARLHNNNNNNNNNNKAKEFAIKVIKKTNPVIGSDPEGVFAEMRALAKGREYPFLAIAHCCFQTEDRLFLVMEHVVGHDLKYYLDICGGGGGGGGRFHEDRARFHAAEIVLALMYLHSQGIVYRDLKLENVLLDRQGHCKLIDFGMSKELHNTVGGKTRTFCGTPQYISPEIIRELDYDYSVDWWSLGVLIYEMLVGFSPFDAETEQAIYDLIKDEQATYPAHLSTEARTLLEGLLTKEPSKRLGCQETGAIGGNQQQEHVATIKRHPFFMFKSSDNPAARSFQWDAIEFKQLKPPYVPMNEDSEDDDCYNAADDYDRVDLSPSTSPSKLRGVSQEDFVNFSYYSDSFKSILQYDTQDLIKL